MSDVESTLVVQETSSPIEAVDAPQTEAGPEEVAKPEVPKKEDFLAPKFAALTRKEKQVREMERAVKAQQAEIEKMRAEWETKTKSNQESETQLLRKLKSNPLKTLSELGLTFDQLTEMQLNEQNPTPQMLIEQMRAELKAEMEEKYGKITESIAEKEKREAQERYDAAVNGYMTELTSFVTENAEKYELIAANDATQLMYETANAYYQQTGRIPSHEEIANAVEEHLEEEANKILKLKKFQNKTAPKVEAKPDAQKTAPTLSNTLAAEVPKSGNKLMSDEESKRNAAKMLVWHED